MTTTDFADRLQTLADRVLGQRESITTEEATKHAFILPFIRELGYDVFNPAEVTPELVADVGVKKGEKVDYAILQSGKPIMIFECKNHDCDLKHAQYSQLYRYFHVTETRFAVLTNGIQYWFFTDLEAPNKMDTQPFLRVDLSNIREGDLAELRKFTRNQYDEENILSTASELKYVRELKRALTEELKSPSEEFLKLLINKVYDGVVTAKVRAQFAPFVEKAYQAHLSDVFGERLKSVLGSDGPVEAHLPAAEEETSEAEAEEGAKPNIETTEEELEGFMIVRAIGAAEVDVQRIAMRDVQSYCGVLFDDNNRKPVCRMYFNGRKKTIGVFDKEDRSETRHDIEKVSDIYKHTDAIRATIRRYLPEEGSEQQGAAE